MSKQTIKEYATKNKISIFHVMKLIKSQKLQTITKLVDGKEVIYIDETSPQNQTLSSTEEKTSSNPQLLQDEIKQLKEEVTKLRAELNRLKVTVFKMAKEDAKVLKI